MAFILKWILFLLCVVLFITSLQVVFYPVYIKLSLSNSSWSISALSSREGQRHVARSEYVEETTDAFDKTLFKPIPRTILSSDSQCRTLFREGSFKNPTLWGPQNCTIMNYEWSDLRSCLPSTNSSHAFAFIGDSRMRQLTHMLKNYLFNTTIRTLFSQKHEYETYTQPLLDLKIEFFWDPYADDVMRNQFSSWLQATGNNAVTMVIVGVGVWHQLPELDKGKEAGIKSLASYQADLQKLYPLMKELAQRIPVVFVAAGLLDYFRREGKRPFNHITVYNELAEKTLNGTGVIFWKSAYTMAELTFDKSPDLNHYSEETTKAMVNVLLNLYCNSKTDISSDHCCSSDSHSMPQSTPQTVPRSANGSSTAVMSTAADQNLINHSRLFCVSITLLFIIHIAFLIIPRVCAQDKASIFASSWMTATESILSLSTIISLCSLFDKLSVIQHVNKEYSPVLFSAATGVIALIAISTTSKTSDPATLNRDQTDEWKGWMQLIIVAYHVTGTSRNLVVYMNLRFLVSSYLVLTGYGHFKYFFLQDKFSWIRVVKVLVRLNMLTAVLCATTVHPYQFYYFMPLVTFWYLITVVLFVIPPRVTSRSAEDNQRHYMLLLLKLLLAVAIVSFLNASEDAFHLLFSMPLWRQLFVGSDGSLGSWHFRWTLDRYSTLFGILLAVLHHMQEKNIFSSWTMKYQSWLNVVIVLSSFLGILLPTGLGLFCTTKQLCNRMHSLTFFIPVISFVALRNAAKPLQSRYSWVMASYGHLSLELFLLQHHLWLADDTHNLLSFVANPIINFLFFTCLLSIASRLTHKATETLTSVKIPNTQVSLADLLSLGIVLGYSAGPLLPHICMCMALMIISWIKGPRQVVANVIYKIYTIKS